TAVVIDMVLNHSFGESPFVQMYMDNWNIIPENPWYNVDSPNPVYSWGYDFNHESEATKELVDSITSFWINEYKIDGFRLDFTKGFTNTPGEGSGFDMSRIEILKRMTNEIWKRKSDALVILEHFTDNKEETELANYGMLIWGNLNGNYAEGAMGYTQNTKSDLEWGLYDKRGWTKPGLVTYMESHDEERITFKSTTYGNSSGEYNIQDLNVALDRMELNSVFHLPLPGAKMIWQFGELGYDYSINTCENGSLINNECRTYPKPIRWDFINNTDRTELFQVMAKMNHLKQNYDEFTPETYSYDLKSEIKWYKLNGSNNHVVAIGNFDVKQRTTSITFPKIGKWYEFFTRDSVEIYTLNQSIPLAPGEYRLYSTRNFDDPHVITENKVDLKITEDIRIYPNPASSEINVSANNEIDEIRIYSLTGELMVKKANIKSHNLRVNTEEFLSGVYLIQVYQKSGSSTFKFIVQ
ncbi:MAG TPA: T9SS type A sorting domain-containing protein, partial [Draconibacterium sp.]|nr:T9SS type A sorting domain-containing protein [Draconibacterium sp.]